MFDWVPLAHTLLYAMVLVSGLMVCVPVGITKENFDGECILYGNIRISSGSLQTGEPANCNYVIYTHVILSVLMGGILTATFCFILIAEFRGNPIRIRTNFFVALALLILHGVVAFLTFIVACIITVGFREFCDDFEQLFHTCKDAQHGMRWPGNINGKHFWDNTSMAVGAAWWNFICWIVLIVLATYVLVRVKSGSYPANAHRTTTTTTTTRSTGSLSTTSKRSVTSSTHSQKTFSIA